MCGDDDGDEILRLVRGQMAKCCLAVVCAVLGVAAHIGAAFYFRAAMLCNTIRC